MRRQGRDETQASRQKGRQGARTLTSIWFLCVTTLELLTLAPTSVTSTGSGGGRHYNFTLAFLTGIANHGSGKFVGGAFFLALDHLNNASDSMLNGTGDTMSFHSIFRDTRNEETTATKEIVDLYCSDTNVTAFIGPDKFCNSAGLLGTSFDMPMLFYDCNDINTLRTNIGKYHVVNMQPSLAYVAKSIVAVMDYFGWTSFYLISGTGGTTNDWSDIGQYLRKLVKRRSDVITTNGVKGVELNDYYHTGLKNKKRFTYPKIIQETRDETRVYVFLGDYNSLVIFLRDLDAEGVTSKGEHVVIAVTDDRMSFPQKQDYFLLQEERSGTKVNATHLSAFRNLLLLTRLEPAADIGKDFQYQVFEKNHGPPINLIRIPADVAAQFNLSHSLRQESYYLYDAVKHYGVTVSSLIRRGLNPYDASLVIDGIRNSTFRSIQGFDVPINADGESEGRYVVQSMAANRDGPMAEMWEVGTFFINGDPVYEDTNHSISWVKGVPVSNPPCGFDGAKCRDDEKQTQWRAIGIVLAVVVLLAIGAVVFVGIRYLLIMRRMRRQALTATRAVCPNSFVELQEHDREGLLVC